MIARKIPAAALTLLLVVCAAKADVFGTGGNQFTLGFVPISGATNPASGHGIVNRDFRMGTYEVTNDQWDKFVANLGVPVTGTPASAYDGAAVFTGANRPAGCVSWYEAAQFVNWLNTSTNHQPAYKFTGTQGTSDYAFATWSAAEADGTNLFRNKNAYYFLPTEDEWDKAAYWNGTSVQDYATKPGQNLYQGHGSGGGWNYMDGTYATNPPGPWIVGSGSQELNGTYDMMGNDQEWAESPYNAGDYSTSTTCGRPLMGGSAYLPANQLTPSTRVYTYPVFEDMLLGFRVASAVITTPPSYHPGDANNSGSVDVVDLGILAKNYDSTGLPHGSGQSWGLADFDDSGGVDVVDLGILAKNYDWTGAPASAAAPEPMTMSLLVAGAAILARRRR